ncbi:hypothetical protein B0H11DRAFT_2232090 [Mycena galericulata]|nr:hypothetical protein B0H11DRAFT_2232090 [Mycena galericulata]
MAGKPVNCIFNNMRKSLILLLREKPGNLQNNTTNTKITDELLREPVFERLFAPLLATYYQTQMGTRADRKPSLVWNFVGTVFAAYTFNFGPRAITVPKLDFALCQIRSCPPLKSTWYCRTILRVDAL